MDPYLLASLLIRIVLELVGKEKASELLSREAIARANEEADLIEKARGLTYSL